MILRFCICIPTYNNDKTIQTVVDACLRETPFPILVIDDGSDHLVNALLTPHERIVVLRHDRNQGKGVALKSAFAHCVSKAYTHAITIDADGQHSASDIRQLVGTALDHPWDVILGFRDMDPNTTPRSSQFGRKFSNFWLWYQTNTYVSDSQSGFRIYPLFFVQNLRCFTRKFDFELEVLARLLWRGVGLRSVSVAVRYFPIGERVSHFHKFHDNVRITIMNIAMIAWSLIRYHANAGQMALSIASGGVVGMITANLWFAFLAIFALCFLMRSNGLWMLFGAASQQVLGRWWGDSESLLAVLTLAATSFFLRTLWATRHDAKKTWTGKIRGGKAGNFLIAKINTYLGQRISYALMVFVVPYFLLFAPKARRASFELAETLMARGTIFKKLFFALRHMFVFACIMLDRLYQNRYREPAFDYLDDGGEHLLRAKAEERGTVLVSAHFGALDMVARATRKYGLFERLVRAEFVAEADITMESVLKRRENAEDELPILSQKEQSILLFKELIEQGKSLVMMGDRPINHSYELVLFCGKLAVFDTTPYRVAQACQTKVLYCFGIKRSMWVYQLVVEEAGAVSPSGDKAFDALLAASSFAGCLEKHLKATPFQWANFFPFWSEVPRPPVVQAEAKARATLLEHCRSIEPGFFRRQGALLYARD